MENELYWAKEALSNFYRLKIKRVFAMRSWKHLFFRDTDRKDAYQT